MKELKSWSDFRKKGDNTMRPANFRLIIAISICALFVGGIGTVQAEEPAYLRGGMEGFVWMGKPIPLIPTPVAGALIELFTEESPTSPVASTTTDEKGYYKLVDLHHGLYGVRVSAENFRTLTVIVWIQGGIVLKRDFYLEMIMPEQWGLLKGRVVRDVGMLTIVPPPIPGAHVTVFKSLVYSNGETMVDPEPVAESLTDQDGAYKIPELPYGFYRVIVEAEGYCRGIANLQMYAPEVELNFKLKILVPTPTVTPIPEGSGKVFGVVMAQDSETSEPYPLAKALVEVSPTIKDSESRVNCIVPPVARTITDENGNYVIENIPVGNWNITARAENYQCSIKNFEMTPDGEIRVDFILKPSLEPGPGGIYGTVMGLKPEEDETSETEEGTKDESDQGIPIAGARVEVFNAPVYDAKDNIVPGPDKPVAVVFTNEEGKYSAVNLEQGLYMVRVTAEKFYLEHKIASVADEPVELNFLLKPVSEPEPTPAPVFGILQGCVTFEKDGAEFPIPSAQLLAIRMNNDNQQMIGNQPMRYTASDENGLYKFEDLIPGLYLVMAKAEGFKPGHGEADVKTNEVTVLNFKLEPADTLTSGTGTIFGKVMTADAPTTTGARPEIRPLEGADILVFKVNRSLEEALSLVPAGSAVSDSSGLFVVDNLRYGLYVVIAKKEGYTWGLRMARVRQLVETKVLFLLIPLGEPEPKPDEGIIYQSASGGTDDWDSAGAPDFFHMPDASRDGARLILHCSDNTNTFGYWYSPADQIPIEPGVIYKSTFSLSSDQTDTSKVPCIRIRFNGKNEQMADMYVINSLGDGAVSPGVGGRTYTHYFTLPSSDISVPVTESGIYISFDLVNLDPRDAKDVTLSLDWVKIESIAESDVPQGNEVLSLDFSTGVYGWSNEFASIFTQPEVISGPYLGLKAKNNKSTYGVWVSPPNAISIEANTIYAVDWNVFSDQADLSTVPGIRMRAGDSSNRLIIQKSVFSNAEGDNSPDGLGRTYTLYYNPPAELAGAGLYLAFDMVNFDSTDGSDATIGLRSVTVRAISAADMP